jgi:ribose transport system permease protein
MSAPQTATTAHGRPLRTRPRLTTTAIVYLVLAGVIVVGAVLTATTGRSMFTPGNISAILTGTSALGFIAIGQTLVILGGSLDLSVPQVVSLSTLVAGVTGMPWSCRACHKN